MTTTIAHKNYDQQLSRALNKYGYSLKKMHPRRRYRGLNLGGYMIIWDKYRACVAGHNFELDLDDVANWIHEMCQE